MWNYTIDPTGRDVDGALHPSVYIHCRNCSTLHSLDNTAEPREPTQKLYSLSDDQQIVPKEPTSEMVAYAAECTKLLGGAGSRTIRAVYRFLLEAARTK